MTTSRDIERVYDLKKLFDKQLDKVDPKLDMSARIAKAAKLMDKVLGTPAWRSEAQLPEAEFVQVEVTSNKPLTKAEVKSLYDKLYKALDAEGLSQKDDSYVVDRLEQAENEYDDSTCDCYECQPCDCPACRPCDCDDCRKQTLLGKFFDYVSR